MHPLYGVQRKQDEALIPMTKSNVRAVRSDAWLFVLLASLAFAYVLARAALVPLVHDEANSFFHYVRAGSWIPFNGKWDAANHVLVMALGNVSYTLFGASPLSLRAFAVLSFLLYAWSAWHLGLRIKDRSLRWTCWAGLLTMPFAIEFFALFRGYGPSFALLLLGILALLRFIERGRTGSMFMASIAMGTAVMANLSLLPLWAIMMAVLVVRIGHGVIRSGPRPVLQRMIGGLPGRVTALVPGLVGGLWMVAFSMGLRERGLLYYGSDRGLVLGSFASLRERLLPTMPDAAGLAICLAVLALLTIALVLVARQRSLRGHALLVLLCGLLFCELVGRIVLGEFFGVLYPKDRAILHIFPLLLLALVCALDVLVQYRSQMRWLALPLLLLPTYTVLGANLHRTIQWPEESIADAIYQMVRDRQEASDHGLLVAGPSPLAVIWDHKLLSEGAAFASLQPAQDPLPWADLVLADARKPELWEKDFKLVLAPDDSGQWLLEPRQPAQRHVVLDSLVAIPATTNEFVELFASGLAARPGSELVVDLVAVFNASRAATGECLLVVQVGEPNADHTFYRAVPVHHQWSMHEDRAMHITVGVDHYPQGDERLSVYLWNLDGREIVLRDGRLRLLQVRAWGTL